MTAPRETREATSVGLDFPHQQARVRELRDEYRAIGPAGAFGLMMIDQTLARAEAAMASGDVIAILRSYEELKGCA